jgi:pSer/pThr/pTyr-binding forkhead associated (FHA) protein
VKVLVLSAPVEPPLYVERNGRTITLGRDEAADVCLPDPTVSARHASLKKRGDRYLLTDEGSTNGTALVGPGGGEPVWLSPGSPRLVQDRDRILLGSVLVEVRQDSPAEGRPSDDLPRDLVTASLARLGLSIEPEQVDAALTELMTLSDEVNAPEKAPIPEPPADPAAIVRGSRSRLITDLLVASAALVLILASGAMLHFFVLKH